MKKVIAFILSFFMIFLNVNISKALGNPLEDNPQWFDKLRTEFRQLELQYGRNDIPALFTAKNEFDFTSHDYRTCRVYNFPKFFGRLGEKDSFLPCLTAMYEKAYKTCKYFYSLGKFTGKLALKQFRDSYAEKVKGSKELNYLCDVFETDDKTIIDATTCSLGLAVCSKLVYGASAAILGTGLIASFKTGVLAPLGIGATLGITGAFLQEATFASQRAKNIAWAIKSVSQQLIEDPEIINDSNVLITAIDEKDFAPTPWNLFRRDDGIWCGFSYIKNLSCAPMGKLYNDRLKKYLQDYDNLFNGNDLAAEKMTEMGKEYSKKHKTGIFPECSIQ